MRAVPLAFVLAVVARGARAFDLGVARGRLITPRRAAPAVAPPSTAAAAAADSVVDGRDADRTVLSRRGALSSLLAGAAAVASGGLVLAPSEARAEGGGGARTIGQISGSGLVFKDTLVVESFDDPKVRGVTLYVSNFERPLTERLQKDFFTEPSYASVTCVRNGKQVEVADNIDKTEKGEPVFEEKRSLLFKELRVQRIYDVEKNTIVYVSFNTRLDKNSDTNKSRFKSSICAVPLD